MQQKPIKYIYFELLQLLLKTSLAFLKVLVIAGIRLQPKHLNISQSIHNHIAYVQQTFISFCSDRFLPSKPITLLFVTAKLSDRTINLPITVGLQYTIKICQINSLSVTQRWVWQHQSWSIFPVGFLLLFCVTVICNLMLRKCKHC